MRDLILLHGALGSDSSMKTIKSALDNHLNCYSFNLSGHGQKSFSNAGFGIGIFAKELAEFIKEHQLKKPDVFGYSMGGYVALYLSAQQPEVLGKILTLGTKFAWTKESAAHETSRMIPEIMEKKIPAYTQKLEKIHGSEWRLLVTKTAQMMKGLGDAPLLNQETLEAIQNEVIVLRGSEDAMVNEEESKWASSCLANGTFESLENQPHPIEKVDLTVIKDCILNYL